MVEDNSRYIPNNYQDYNPGMNMEELQEQVFKLLVRDLDEYLYITKPNMRNSVCIDKGKQRESSDMYVGPGGNLFVYLKVYKFLLDNENLVLKYQKPFAQFTDEKIMAILDKAQYLELAEDQFKQLEGIMQKENNLKSRDPLFTYYMSPAGTYTLGCHLAFYKNDAQSFFQRLQQVLDYKNIVIKSKRPAYELLYGVIGYLYCLLDLQKSYQLNDNINQEYKINVESAVLDMWNLYYEINGGLVYNVKFYIFAKFWWKQV